MVSTRASAGGTFPVPESYAPGAKEASVDLRNGTFKDNGSAKPAENGAAKPADDVSGPMLEPSAFNKNWVRICQVLPRHIGTWQMVPLNVSHLSMSGL